MSCHVGKATEVISFTDRLSSAHFPNFLSLHLRHSSFSNPSVTLPTSQLILQPFRRFTYVTAPSVALPTSQLILQPFRCFTYITTHSPTLLSLLLRHRLFTYVTWRAAHAGLESQRQNICNLLLSSDIRIVRSSLL